MRNSAIAASGLRKAYKDKVVLDGIDLDVETGTVFSLLGPNGAGKTTTVNVLTTLIKADSGTALVAGHDVATETKTVRAAIGVTGQFAAVDELLTGQENLRLMADLKGMRSSESKPIVADLLSVGHARQAYLGVVGQEINGEIAQLLNLPAEQGLLIAQLTRPAPFHSPSNQLPIVIFGVDLKERVRIPERELKQLSLDLRCLVFLVRRGKRVVCVDIARRSGY